VPARSIHLLAALLVAIVSARSKAADRAETSDDPSVPPMPAFGGRLDVRTAMSVRDEALATDEARVKTSGSALSHLGLSGVWFPGWRAMGLAARLDVDRFGLRGDDPVAGPIALVATGIEAYSTLTARLVGAGGRLTAEGRIGYGFTQVPLVRVMQATGSSVESSGAASMPVTIAVLRTHGPEVGAGLMASAAPWLVLEATGRVLPLTFSGQYDGKGIDLRRFSVGAAASIGRIEAGSLRVAALIGYELGGTVADATAVDLSQVQHRAGLGVRAAFQPPPRPTVPAVDTSERLAVELPAAPVRGRLRGLVRGAVSPGQPPGRPLAGVLVEVDPSGSTVRTDEDGTFVLEDLPVGPVVLRLSGDGLAPAEEAVAIPEVGETVVELTLRPAAVSQPAVVLGLVRGDSGAPVGATVRITELGRSARTNEAGQFRLEVPPGRYTLTIEAEGFVRQRKKIAVGGGEQSIHNVDMQRGR
jgi:hypothetical protein